MKRLNYLLMAILMVLGLAQCKKNNDTDQLTSANSYKISLDVEGDSKVIVTPASDYATVRFQKDDVIYVGYNGKFVGTLEHDGTKFSGSIFISESDATLGKPLYFYFMGNQEPTTAPTAGSTTSCKFKINDQTGGLPVISMAPSTVNFSSSITTYSAALNNRCALVKFKPEEGKEIADGTITLWGMNNKITVQFGKPTQTDFGISSEVDSDNGGEIKLYKKNNTEFWAILMPTKTASVASAKALGYLKTTGIEVPVLNASDYLNAGIEIGFVAAPDKAFSTPNDTYIKFATGNLQCTRKKTDWSEYEWSFKTNQYDIDNKNGDDVGVDYADSDVISHFGWGASGYYDGTDTYAPLNYKPNSTSDTKTTADVRNPYHYGPSWTQDPSTDNYNTAGVNIANTNYDWGYYLSAQGSSGQSITNGEGHNWRLFTKAEIAYILGPNAGTTPIPGKNCRYSSTINGVENARFVKVCLNDAGTVSHGNSDIGLYGLIIFPDVYVHPDPSVVPYPVNINSLTSPFADSYSIEQWEEMEKEGAVFLPAAGGQENHKISGINVQCYYWTSTYNNYKDSNKPSDNPAEYAKNLRVGVESMVTDSRTNRNRGSSVRLVRDVTP